MQIEMSRAPARRGVGQRGALTRAEARRLAEVQQPATDAAARIQAAAYAAHTGMLCTEILTALESQAFRRAPTGEERYTSIVNQFAGLCCHELAKLAL